MAYETIENSAHPYAPGAGTEVQTVTIPGANALVLTFDMATKVYSSPVFIDNINIYGYLGTKLVGFGPYLESSDYSGIYTGTSLRGISVIVPGDTVTIHLVTRGGASEWGYKATVRGVNYHQWKARPRGVVTFYPPPPNIAGSVAAEATSGDIYRWFFSGLSYSSEICQYDWSLPASGYPTIHPDNIQQIFVAIKASNLADSNGTSLFMSFSLTDSHTVSDQDPFDFVVPWYYDLSVVYPSIYHISEIYSGKSDQAEVADKNYIDARASHITLIGSLFYEAPNSIDCPQIHEEDIFIWIIWKYHTGIKRVYTDGARSANMISH